MRPERLAQGPGMYEWGLGLGRGHGALPTQVYGLGTNGLCSHLGHIAGFTGKSRT